MLKKVILGVILVVVGVPLLLLGASLFRPDHYTVHRSTLVAAPPDAVYAAVADFHRWDRWSPWAGLDPAQKSTIQGDGVGAVYAWNGNDKVGEGRMTIVEARRPERLGILLEFIRPYQSKADTGFTIAPDAAGSRVTWEMAGHYGTIERVMCMFMDMDKMIGGDFERGLVSLKREVEQAK
jgi:uncharacterized protein YndB with AHSA1/START domain